MSSAPPESATIQPPAASTVAWPDAQRAAAFWRWFTPLAAQLGLQADSLAPASADASFRRYLRVQAADGSSRIVMDAPPPQEDVRPFIDIASRIAAAGLHAPAVLASDADQGFVLLSDLGRQLYLPTLQAAAPDQADRLMREAVAALVHWQRHMDGTGLPAYRNVTVEATEEAKAERYPNRIFADDSSFTEADLSFVDFESFSSDDFSGTSGTGGTYS